MTVVPVYTEKHCATRQGAISNIFEYIEIVYYRHRMHSALNDQSPEAFETMINSSRSDGRIYVL